MKSIDYIVGTGKKALAIGAMSLALASGAYAQEPVVQTTNAYNTISNIEYTVEQTNIRIESSYYDFAGNFSYTNGTETNSTKISKLQDVSNNTTSTRHHHHSGGAIFPILMMWYIILMSNNRRRR
jgi:hypothetical protein